MKVLVQKARPPVPEDAPPDFFQKMMADFRGQQSFYRPWNRRLRSTRLKRPVHYWDDDKNSTSTSTFVFPPCPGPAASASWAC